VTGFSPAVVDFQDMLLRLLPPGRAWNRDPTSTMGALALGLAAEFWRLDGRGMDLIEEADPRTTNQMITDWERICGLPDRAVPRPTTLAARQAAVVDRLVSVATQTDADFIALVARLGYSATITHHTPFAADIGTADSPVYDGASVFWWEVNITVPIGTATPLVLVEHAVTRQAQSHTLVTFNYIFV